LTVSRGFQSIFVFALSIGVASALGCRSVYYDTMEQFGKHKRHILRDRVDDGRNEQAEAQEQFKSTYERFKEASGYSGGELEDVHARLTREYERSEERAEAVRDRIESIERVAADLFAEWEDEIELIQNSELQRSSERKLRLTRSRYDEMIAAMKRAESKMEPVLTAFRDQVLYLKHNLNARAIASLAGTVTLIEDEVADLIDEIQNSLDEADEFIATLEG